MPARVGALTLPRQVDPLGRVGDLAVADFQACLSTNIVGALTFCQAALPWLRQASGRIVAVSSGLAALPAVALAPYCWYACPLARGPP